MSHPTSMYPLMKTEKKSKNKKRIFGFTIFQSYFFGFNLFSPNDSKVFISIYFLKCFTS